LGDPTLDRVTDVLVVDL